MIDPSAQNVALRDIDEPEHRLRSSIDPEQLGTLTDDIAANGLIQPIAIRGPSPAGRYEIIAGHRRFLAHELLNRETIAARVYPWTTNPLILSVSENLQRADLNPLEEADVVRRLVEAGQSLAAVSRLLRRSGSWVHQRIKLLEAPPDIRDAVERGAISLGVAQALVDVDHAPYRQELIAEAERVGAKVATASVWVQHYLADRERIVANLHTIQEIAERRESWKYYVPCDGCGADHEYTETRSLRLCHPCIDAMAQQLAAVAQRA